MDGMKRSNATFPPGFRFHPTDEELIIHYLKRKVSSFSSNQLISIIADVNIYKFNPWELPDNAFFGDNEWFFFSPRDRKYPNGTRPNRAAASGFWKATGTDKPIITSVGSECLGMKKALVFYKGSHPKAVKTDWTMVEYRLLDDYFLPQRPKASMRVDDWVLCRVRQKGKVTQQIGGRNYDSSSSSSLPLLPRGYLQGQEMVTENIIQGNEHYQLPTDQYQMAPLKSEELDEKGFLEGSPEYSVFSADLTSIESVFSPGALDELFTASTSSNNIGNPTVFQVSSPSQRFSEF